MMLPPESPSPIQREHVRRSPVLSPPAVALGVVFAALLACKHPGPQPQSASEQANAAGPTDAGALDDAQAMDGGAADAASPGETVTVECDNDAAACEEKAKAACPNGFDQVQKSDAPIPVDTSRARAGKPAVEILKPKITPHNAPPPPMRTTLVVRCHPASGGAGAELGGVPPGADASAPTK